MARFATIAAGVALMLSQPVLAAPAQSSDSSEVGSRGDDNGRVGFYHDPGKIAIALGALGAFTWGLINAFSGHGHHGRTPTSP